MDSEKVVEWASKKIAHFDNDRKLYNISALIISVFDILMGVLSMVYAAVTLGAVLTSFLCACVWGGRFIQMVKIEKMASALKNLTKGLLYLEMLKRKSDRRHEKMKTVLQNIKNNPLTIVFAIILGVVGGYAGYYICAEYVSLLWLDIVVGVACGIVIAIIVFVLGWDKVKAALLKQSTKTLDDDQRAKLDAYIQSLKDEKAAEEEAEEQAAEEEAEAAAYAAIVKKHNEENEAYNAAIQYFRTHPDKK